MQQVEGYFSKHNIYTPYIALETLNFLWSFHEVLEFDELYNKGVPLMDLAEHFRRTHEEMALIIMDRALKGKIKPRGVDIERSTTD